jgi:hypothetical protein
MSIYNIPRRNNVNYRKIYEDKFGPIPKDEMGRSFHIHHISNDYLQKENIFLKLK